MFFSRNRSTVDTQPASFEPVTSSCFPTPQLALRSGDSHRWRQVCAFAEDQAAAANRVAHQIQRGLTAAVDAEGRTAALGDAFVAVQQWRHDLAAARPDARVLSATAWPASKFLTPISDETTNYDRVGSYGRLREGTTWNPHRRTFADGSITPASFAVWSAGQWVSTRFAAEAPEADVLQNICTLPSGDTVRGNRLLRFAAARAAAAELVARRAAQGVDVSQFEDGGDPMYIATAREADRARLHHAALQLLAGDYPDDDTAVRAWATACYLLFQAPQTKKGSDAVARVFLVAAGAVLLGWAPRLPHDLDLMAFTWAQDHFVELMSREVCWDRAESLRALAHPPSAVASWELTR